ncbi:hypothetical protein SAMN04489860_0808 [Paraoerskovia marina]|uniref:Uncharacterized protein n=1 Tax=Paraoerskovia marina TaxID=545619 RepID=A0A1H1PHR7_9CELL|nr:hypothetical protein [Paraoerskovia marina]SDS10663.1 hypothetical protein SAMN04489860_0808 [Paraoerskovia marina]
MADLLKVRLLVVAVVVSLLITGCGVEQSRWEIRSDDLSADLDPVPFEDWDDYLYLELTCGIAAEAWASAKMRWSSEAEVSQYRGPDLRIQTFVVPYNGELGQRKERFLAPGSAMEFPRSAAEDCDRAADEPGYETPLGVVAFEAFGDRSEAAISADRDLSTLSEPLGWSEHAEGPFKNPDLLIIDGMEDRYAEGYYAMVGDTYVGVHVVSSVEPEVSAEQVMDVMREKLEADPPEARYAGGEVSR